MNGSVDSRHWLRRFMTAMILVITIAGGLWAVHWAAIRYVTSRGPQPAFPEIRLQHGISRSEVLDKLGPPDVQLHQVHTAGQPVEETIRYVRGRCELELVFVDGKLDSWAETQPIDFDKLKHARTYAVECCEPTEAQPSEPSTVSAGGRD